MKVWAVLKDDAYDDGYDKFTYTHLDTIWSDQDMAREQIKQLCNKWIKDHKSGICDRCTNPCASGHECQYHSIEAPTLDKIIIEESDFEKTTFYIKEMTLDESSIKEG